MRKIPPLSTETVSDLTARNAALYPNSVAFIFEEKSYTWKECEDITELISINLIGHGIGKGTHVAFWSLNHIGVIFYMLAAMKIGAVVAGINYSYKSYELKTTLQCADIEYLFLGESKNGSDYAAAVNAVRHECPKLLKVYDLRSEFAAISEMHLAGETPVDTELRKLQKIKSKISAYDVANITFTSGTTKAPKPVMLTYYNIVNDVYQLSARMETDQNDILIADLPLFHSSGITGMLFNALVVGMTTVVHRKFTAQNTFLDIEKYHVTALMAVPSMLEMMANSPECIGNGISSLRVCQTSGASTSPARLKKIKQLLHIEHFIIGYGQTECSPVVTTVLYDDDLSNVTETVGVPLPYVQVRIWNLEDDCETAVGDTGEIQVLGFNTMKGYYNCEAENSKKFTADGWLKTTDAGYLDANGYLHFVARLGDMIKRYGENISLAELEFIIEQFTDDVVQVKVVGVEVEGCTQEEIACFIQTKETKIDANKLRGFVKDRLASFKVPKFVYQVDHFPMTGTGKIDQAALKSMALEMSGSTDI